MKATFDTASQVLSRVSFISERIKKNAPYKNDPWFNSTEEEIVIVMGFLDFRKVVNHPAQLHAREISWQRETATSIQSENKLKNWQAGIPTWRRVHLCLFGRRQVVPRCLLHPVVVGNEQQCPWCGCLSRRWRGRAACLSYGSTQQRFHVDWWCLRDINLSVSMTNRKAYTYRSPWCCP